MLHGDTRSHTHKSLVLPLEPGSDTKLSRPWGHSNATVSALGLTQPLELRPNQLNPQYLARKLRTQENTRERKLWWKEHFITQVVVTNDSHTHTLTLIPIYSHPPPQWMVEIYLILRIVVRTSKLVK